MNKDWVGNDSVWDLREEVIKLQRQLSYMYPPNGYSGRDDPLVKDVRTALMDARVALEKLWAKLQEEQAS